MSKFSDSLFANGVGTTAFGQPIPGATQPYAKGAFNAPGYGLGDLMQGWFDATDGLYRAGGDALDWLYDNTIGDLTNTRDAFTGEQAAVPLEIASMFIPGLGALRGAKMLGRGLNTARSFIKGKNALKGVEGADKISDAAKLLQTGEGTAEELAAAKNLMQKGQFTSRVPMYQVTTKEGATAFSPTKKKAIDNLPENQKSPLDFVLNRGAYNPAQLPKGTPVVRGSDGLYYAIPDTEVAAGEAGGFLNALRRVAGGGKAETAAVPKVAAAKKGSKVEKTAAKETGEAAAAAAKAETEVAQAQAAQAAAQAQAAQAAASVAPQGRAAIGPWSPVSEPVSNSIFTELRPTQLRSGRLGYQGDTFADVLNRTSRSPKRRNRRTSK